MNLKEKIQKLLEMTGNLETGAFGGEKTDYDETGFRLESQLADFEVDFDENGGWWAISREEGEDGKMSTQEETGDSWNSFVDWISRANNTFFMNGDVKYLKECNETLTEGNKFELRDTVQEIDVATDFMFDLVGLYDSAELDETEKKLIATIISKEEDTQKKAEELFDILNQKNLYNFDEGFEHEEKELGEIRDGDEIVYNGEHLYVTDSLPGEDWVWVTDEECDRNNKKCAGWTLKKDWIDEVIHQPEEVEECVEEDKQEIEECANTEVVTEETHAQVARPEGDKVKSYNNALKYAKRDNAPYCYGYTNSRLGGKFFAFEQPFKWDGDDKAFRAKYKNTGVIYIAYPDKEYVQEELNECDNTVKEEVVEETPVWKFVHSKQVPDADGFLTDYTWYENADGTQVMVFGDSDVYGPEDDYFDATFDNRKEAEEWFNNYQGMEEIEESYDDAEALYDIQGKAVANRKRDEVLDEFNMIFNLEDSEGGINCADEEVKNILRSFLEDKGYAIEASESNDKEHPIHVEWFKIK